jgi:SAM-dependent methyltransferase
VSISTQQLYNQTNHNWKRNEPMLLSDYTARPFLLEWCRQGKPKDILDLGCGEGYFARNLKKQATCHIHAIDISEEMINRAMEQEAIENLGIVYGTGTATDLSKFPDASFDLVVAVFLFNYLTVEQSADAMLEIYRVLRDGGRFIFAVPHPSMPFLRNEEPPFYFCRAGAGYFTGRNRQMDGEIWRRDGRAVAVRCVHKTLEDYFACLRLSGFNKLPELKELHVTDEILAIDPIFFTPLLDQPLHLAFKLEK